jgi:hypothetical protein
MAINSHSAGVLPSGSTGSGGSSRGKKRSQMERSRRGGCHRRSATAV